eukprot:scaffold137063_cov72-Phaeocystis_antarctica.AAC.6
MFRYERWSDGVLEVVYLYKVRYAGWRAWSSEGVAGVWRGSKAQYRVPLNHWLAVRAVLFHHLKATEKVRAAGSTIHCHSGLSGRGAPLGCSAARIQQEASVMELWRCLGATLSKLPHPSRVHTVAAADAREAPVALLQLR